MSPLVESVRSYPRHLAAGRRQDVANTDKVTRRRYNLPYRLSNPLLVLFRRHVPNIRFGRYQSESIRRSVIAAFPLFSGHFAACQSAQSIPRCQFETKRNIVYHQALNFKPKSHLTLE